MDDALCGGSSAAGGNTQAPRVADMLDSRIAAVIMMGNPRHADGLSYNVGTAEASGVRIPHQPDRSRRPPKELVC